jgi:hypothetical protein
LQSIERLAGNLELDVFAALLSPRKEYHPLGTGQVNAT